MDRPLIALDTETANTRGAPHLVELGAVRVVEGEIVDTFAQLICPAIPIEPEAEAIHGISDEDVRAAAAVGEVLEDFRSWAADDWLAAHSAGHDARTLAFECARNGVEPPSGPFIDSLKLAVRWIPEARDHKLKTLIELLELEQGGEHRALGDAVACWKVIEECIERSSSMHECHLSALLNTDGKPITVAAKFPGPARMTPRLRPLQAATQAGAEITILYGEKTNPPAKLPITPRFLFESHKKSYLEAECGQTGLLKTYLLERVQRVL